MQQAVKRFCARPVRRRLAVAGAVSAGLLAFAPAANAVAWWSISNPLTATSGGVAKAQAYGQFDNVSYSYARVNNNERDPQPGGNKVFVDNAFQFYAPSASGVMGWNVYSTQQTTRSNSASWLYYPKQTSLSEDSSQARARIHTCEDQSFSPDPCSVNALPSFTY
ncbi:MAG: hypothetical protein JWN95_1867 [Frankiales bacterium]|nr:hypothetical protein [Frankiales bacterium]